MSSCCRIRSAPRDALFDSMPEHALAAVQADYVAPADEIGAIIGRLTGQDIHEGARTMPRAKDLEPQLPSEHTGVGVMEGRYGSASALTCPDCGGALWEVDEGGVARYQCHTGHQYAPDALDVEQRDAVDSALWSAVRVLEEHAELKMRLARRAGANGLATVRDGFRRGARDAHRQAQAIRKVLFSTADSSAGAIETVKREVATARRPPTRRKLRRTKRRH